MLSSWVAETGRISAEFGAEAVEKRCLRGQFGAECGAGANGQRYGRQDHSRYSWTLGRAGGGDRFQRRDTGRADRFVLCVAGPSSEDVDVLLAHDSR